MPAPQIARLRRGGRRATIAAAITELYAAGLVIVDGRGALRRGDAVTSTGLPVLARAIYRTLVVPRSRHSLVTRGPVRAALRSTLDDLVRCGAAPTPTRWWMSRLVLVAAVAVTLYGVTRSSALPPPLLLPAVALPAVAIWVWFLPRRTVAGARLLRRLRQEEAARWRDTVGTALVESWTPADAARANALTGMILSGLQPSLRRGIRPRSWFDGGGRSLGDGVSAYGGRGLGGGDALP